MLAARDDYVRATAALERSARLRTAEPVDEERLAAYMESGVLPWTDEERRMLEPLLPRLERFLSGLKWNRSKPILLIKVSDQLEDGLPHTRANAVVLPEGVLRRWSAAGIAYAVAHEVFHVLSRDNPALREQLYGSIGFRPCSKMEIPPPLARLRLTNPDAPESRHAITVRFRGETVEALPFVHFPSGDIDPRAGFKTQIRVSWLLVEREGDGCRARGGGAREERVAQEELQGLDEQVGRNTRYLIHPEEILADNFALLFLATLRDTPPKVPSPEILDRMRRILAP